MKNLIAAFVAIVVAVILGAIGVGFGAAGLAQASPAARSNVPSDNTIVEVTGDKEHGFGIFYYDGSSIFPPTDSEASAECSEYDTRVARVRCRSEVRTWYRDLAALKNALDWAHASD